MLSNPLKRGCDEAFENFDAYQLAKYDRDGEVKLKDVLKIVHPKPKTPERSEIYRLLRERELPIPETWETYISVHGSTKENWEHILPKMGYMAKLRNLRNFLDKGVDLEPVLEHLTNRKAVRNSKQFPYRFFSAYRELENLPSPETPTVLEALETALEISVENVPEFKGTTFISGQQRIDAGPGQRALEGEAGRDRGRASGDRERDLRQGDHVCLRAGLQGRPHDQERGHPCEHAPVPGDGCGHGDERLPRDPLPDPGARGRGPDPALQRHAVLRHAGSRPLLRSAERCVTRRRAEAVQGEREPGRLPILGGPRRLRNRAVPGD